MNYTGSVFPVPTQHPPQFRWPTQLSTVVMQLATPSPRSTRATRKAHLALVPTKLVRGGIDAKALHVAAPARAVIGST